MRVLLICLLLVACTAESEKPARRTPKERLEASEIQLGKTPQPRVYRYTDAELRVIDVPVKDSSNFVELQRCFVWRDLEFKTATMSCGTQSDLPPPTN
jgi:hypothetical protein